MVTRKQLEKLERLLSQEDRGNNLKNDDEAMERILNKINKPGGEKYSSKELMELIKSELDNVKDRPGQYWEKRENIFKRLLDLIKEGG